MRKKDLSRFHIYIYFFKSVFGLVASSGLDSSHSPGHGLASFLQYSGVIRVVQTLINSFFRASRFRIKLLLHNVLHPVPHILYQVEVRRVARSREERDVLLGKEGLAD